MRNLMQELVRQLDSHLGFEMKQGRLLYKGKLVLAKVSARIPLVLKKFHDSASGGLSGYFRTYKRIADHFIEKVWRKTSKSVCKNMSFVRVTNMKPFLRLVCCKPCLFPHQHGLICP